MERLLPFIVQNWLLFAALIVILGLLFVNLAKSRLLGLREIRSEEAVRLINHDNALPVDTRSSEEFAKGHILGALNLPDAKLENPLGDLEAHRGRALILYCEDGRRSARAFAALKRNGFTNVVGLSGGLASWRSAGLPLVVS